jgi:hypothetical protein
MGRRTRRTSRARKVLWQLALGLCAAICSYRAAYTWVSSDSAWVSSEVLNVEGYLCALAGFLFLVASYALGAVITLNRKRKETRLLGLPLFLAICLTCCLGVLLGRQILSREEDRNERHLERVIAKLEVYRRQNGRYPEDLEPIEGCKQPYLHQGGQQLAIYYQRSDKDSFILSHETWSSWSRYYDSYYGKWMDHHAD